MQEQQFSTPQNSVEVIKSPVDDDLEAIESGEYTTLERAVLTQQIIDELTGAEDNANLLKRGSAEDMPHSERTIPEGYAFYWLPNTLGDMQDPYLIRENSTDTASILHKVTPRGRRVIGVAQNRMWKAPADKPFYLTTTMSECSTIVARGETDVFVAHVGYSERGTTEKLLQFLIEQGIPLEKIFGIVSTGEYQAARSKDSTGKTPHFDFTPLHTIEEYVALGLLPGNISSFTHEFADSTRTNMASVLVTPAYTYTHNFDLKVGDGRTSPREQVLQRYNEKVLETK